jgi:GNAT superfamily N-acetyltransferase
VAIEIRPLREADDRTTFRSGDPDLDRFFVRYAGQNQFRHHIGTTYVAVEVDRTLGYATVAPGNLEAGALPITVRRTLPRYPLPVLRLARLAVDATAQGRGVGATLLRHVFLLALQMSQEYGCIGILVDAKRNAVEFYARFGFSPLEISEGEIEARPKPTPLFLPLELIAAALVP